MNIIGTILRIVTCRNILMAFALLFGPFLFVYGGYDDSPGAQGLGLLIFLSGLVYLIRLIRRRRTVAREAERT